MTSSISIGALLVLVPVAAFAAVVTVVTAVRARADRLACITDASVRHVSVGLRPTVTAPVLVLGSVAAVGGATSAKVNSGCLAGNNVPVILASTFLAGRATEAGNFESVVPNLARACVYVASTVSPCIVGAGVGRCVVLLLHMFGVSVRFPGATAVGGLVNPAAAVGVLGASVLVQRNIR